MSIRNVRIAKLGGPQNMAETSGSQIEVAPDLLPILGGWMAVSPRDSSLKIGVIGATKQEAEVSFQEAWRAWEALVETGSKRRAVA